MTSRRGPEQAEPAIERYLAEVAASLPAVSRAQAGIMAELRSGLLDAADAYQFAGLTPARAARASTCEFGDPADVAREFLADIAASHARRVAVLLLATGPLVGLLWIATALASHLSIGVHVPWLASGTSIAASAGIVLLAIAVGVTACGATFGIAVTGRLTRWLRVRPGRAPAAAAIAGFGAIAADGLGLAMLAGQLATSPGRLMPVLSALAAAASLGRLTIAGRAARHCLAFRARLT